MTSQLSYMRHTTLILFIELARIYNLRLYTHIDVRAVNLVNYLDEGPVGDIPTYVQ